MPIRTNRGRAAVYRRIWGWPLRSPAHLISVLVGIVALVITLNIVISNTMGSSTNETSISTSRYSETADRRPVIGVPTLSKTILPTRVQAPTAVLTPTPLSEETKKVAENWVTAWLDHPPGRSAQQWLDGLRPWTSEELLPNLQSVDPANVPTAIKSAIRVTQSSTESADFEADLENGKLVLTVVKRPEGWRVHQYSRVG